MRSARLATAAIAVVVLAGCSGAGAGTAGIEVGSGSPPDPTSEADDGLTQRRTGPAASQHPPNAVVDGGADHPAVRGPGDGDDEAESARPVWLGTRVLPLAEDGFGVVIDTPPELRDRRLPPPEHLAPPDDDEFAARVEPVPTHVAARSTWGPHCPVGLDELRYVTVSFWGFDESAHTGELLVHASAADDLVAVFAALFEARFPIEEMRIVAAEELDAPPTGDGNNTTAFVCRAVVSGSAWSQHAYGLAVDINPFHNPYVRGERVLPELASSYLDRDDHRPGMIQPGDVVTAAFDAIGWGWGGRWATARDWMHFSATGR